MQMNSVRHIRKVRAAVMTVAALTFAGIGAIGAGSAHAGTKGASASIDQFAATYTCDALANLGPNLASPGAVVIKGTGNCVASNGAPDPVPPNFIPNAVSLVQRSDETVYHCYSGYDAATFVNLPTFVESIACVPAS